MGKPWILTHGGVPRVNGKGGSGRRQRNDNVRRGEKKKGPTGMIAEDMTNDQPIREERGDKRINTEQGERLIGAGWAGLENKKSKRTIGETLLHSQNEE